MFVYLDNTSNTKKSNNKKVTAQNNKTKVKKTGNQRIETKVKGSYVCTYLIDSKGSEILLKKVPVFGDLLNSDLNERLKSIKSTVVEDVTTRNNSNDMTDLYKNEMLMRSALFNMKIRSLL